MHMIFKKKKRQNNFCFFLLQIKMLFILVIIFIYILFNNFANFSSYKANIFNDLTSDVREICASNKILFLQVISFVSSQRQHYARMDIQTATNGTPQNRRAAPGRIASSTSCPARCTGSKVTKPAMSPAADCKQPSLCSFYIKCTRSI